MFTFNFLLRKLIEKLETIKDKSKLEACPWGVPALSYLHNFDRVNTGVPMPVYPTSSLIVTVSRPNQLIG